MAGPDLRAAADKLLEILEEAAAPASKCPGCARELAWDAAHRARGA